MKKNVLLIIVLLLTKTGYTQTAVELAGKPAHNYPIFRWVQNFNADDTVSIAIDGNLYPAIAGVTAAVYVVNHPRSRLASSLVVTA